MKKRIRLHPLIQDLMRVTVVQWLLIWAGISLGYAHTGRTQDLLDRTVTLKIENMEVRKALSQIEKLANVRFVYSSNTIRANRKVTVVAVDRKLSEVLNQTLKPLNISYRILGGQIMLQHEAGIQDTQQPKEGTESKTDKNVSGRVTDEKGEPVPGVNILLKGTSQGTITDIEGRYNISVPDENAVLIFSFVGFITQEVTAGAGTDVNVTLQVDKKSLEEVVVVGYGTQRKKDITSAVSVINVEEIGDVPASNVTRLLQGQAAGVVAKQKNGEPGGQFEVRIRGVGSLGALSDPLYVVDGFAVGTQVGQNLNPNDIETISVLKDAASTAIYGARGSNGVVLITTKSGKEGKAGLSFSLDYGVQNLPKGRKVKVMNGVEFAEFKKEIFIDNFLATEERLPTLEEIPESFRYPEQTKYSTNWYDAILNSNAPYTDMNLTMSSGKGPVKSMLSVGYYKEAGALIVTNYDRLSIRANLEGNVNKFITLGANINGTYSKSNLAETNGRNAIAGASLIMDPREPMYDENGALRPYIGGKDDVFGFPNPVFLLKNVTRNRNIADILSNGYAELNLAKGLKFRSSLNTRLKYEYFKLYVPSTIGQALGTGTSGAPPRNAQGQDLSEQLVNLSADQLLTYVPDLGSAHQLDVMAGVSSQKETVKGVQGFGNTYPDDLVPYLGAAIIKSSNSFEYQWTMLAYLARINYAFKDKYLLSASMRREGSSRFGKNTKYGNFPAASLGWRISEENFMPKTDWLNDLKFRASWGVTGNNDIGNYTHLAFMRTENYILGDAIAPGKVVESFANANLKWEKSNQLDLGLDISLFANQLNFTLEWYKKNTRDMLFSVPVPSASGFTSVWTNLGKVQNKGLELAGDYRVRFGEVSFKANANITFNRSKILQLRGEDTTPIWGGSFYGGYNVQKIGRPIGMIYGYRKLGIFNTQAEIDAWAKQDGAIPGNAKFWDADGNGEITYDTQDMVEIGNPNPDFTWGTTLSADYKGFDLSVQLTGAQNYDMYRNIESSTMNMDGVFNVLAKAKDRWRSPENPGSNPNDVHAQGRAGKHAWKWSRESSDRYVYDASHMWVRNITLGYTINGKSILKNARVFVSGTNLFLLTKYPGSNPEANQRNGTTELGYDDESYPIPRTLAGGIRVNF